MHRSRWIKEHFTGLLVLTCLVLGGTLDVVAATPEAMRIKIAAIAQAESNAARRAVIEASLQRAGIPFNSESFTVRGTERLSTSTGVNVVATLPGASDAPTLLLGAHYDRVDAGAGAVDNASGVAVVLALLEAFQAVPLENVQVNAVFFDLEEAGLFGSMHFVRSRAPNELPAYYINFDVFGYGDALWMIADDGESRLVTAMEDLSAQRGKSLTVDPHYPPSDHFMFMYFTAVETYSISLVNRNDIAAFQAIARGSVAEPSLLLQILHTSRDTMEHIDAEAIVAAVAVVEAAIRAFDASIINP